MKTKCIVKGCMNHSDGGRFIGDLCAPCHTMLQTGEVHHKNITFIGELSHTSKGNSVLPDWTRELPLQQQAVIVLALRGPDGFPKYHASKRILYYYRACVLKAAHFGRMLRDNEHCGSLMSLQGFLDPTSWDNAMKNFREIEDELPLHYYTHLMHGAQVLAYKHPDVYVRNRWSQFYWQCCQYLHTPVETVEEMNVRLNDFGRPLDEVYDGEG